MKMILLLSIGLGNMFFEKYEFDNDSSVAYECYGDEITIYQENGVIYDDEYDEYDEYDEHEVHNEEYDKHEVHNEEYGSNDGNNPKQNSDNMSYSYTEQNLESDYQQIYDLLHIESTEKLLRKANVDIDFKELLWDISHGDGKDVGNRLIALLKETLVGELILNKGLMIQIITIVLLGSIFVNLASSFGTGFVSENGFYITYLIITSIMLVSFTSTLDMVSAAIERTISMVKIIVPLYALAMNFVGQAVSAVGMYELVMVGIWIVQVVILRFIIPMVKFYVIISLINNLTKEDSFSKLGILVMNIVSWVLKTVVYFVIGLNIIKGLIEPQIDAIGRNTVNRLSTIIPGGGIVSALTGTFLGAGVVVKNSIGVAGIVIIILVVFVPIIKLLLVMLTIRITSVMIQPIGEKRYVDGVESLAKGNQLLMQALFCSAVLFMLTIAIVAYSAKGGG
ncbi:MAG: stage III sporulation protein AE [Lachnospiraceae bacterium]|nr:stage III sporulation protein AE [Lachnospiraceae bacterium]